MTLSPRCRARLDGVDKDLIRVVERASELGVEFIVTEGVRSMARQIELKRKGASRTLNSRHLSGHAVDLADAKAAYADADMIAIEGAMKRAARELGIPIECGIDWGRKPGQIGWDSPHYQLPWKSYPAAGAPLKERLKDAVSVVANARVGAGVAAGGTAVATKPEAVPAIPAPPAVVTDTLSNLTLWQTMGETLWSLKAFAVGQPLLAAGVGIGLAVCWLWPARKRPA